MATAIQNILVEADGKEKYLSLTPGFRETQTPGDLSFYSLTFFLDCVGL